MDTTISSNSSSADGSQDDVGARLSGTDSNVTDASVSGARNASGGDTCAYYALAEGDVCRQRRSCYDCLNVEVKSEKSGCALTATGVCTSMDMFREYNSTSGYLPSEFGSSSNISTTTRAFNVIPAANATYCEASDDACADCYAVAMNTSSDITNSSTTDAASTMFCLGASGCICISACEPSIWTPRATPDCGLMSIDATPAPQTTQSTSEVGYNTVQILITMAQVLGVFSLMFLGVRRQVAEPAAFRPRRVVRSPRDHLRLSQWRAMQQELIEREKEKPPEETTLAAVALVVDRAAPS